MHTVLKKLKNNRVSEFIRLHKKISIAAIALLLVLVVIFRPKPPEEIPTEKVVKKAITQSLSTSGKVNSENAVDLHFLSVGKITSVRVKRGDVVTAGQVIATLDQRTIQKNLEGTLIDYSKQRNTFDQTKDNNSGASDETLRRILENNQFDLNKAVLSVELQELAKEASVLTTPIAGVVTRADITVSGVMAGVTTTYSIADPEKLTFQVEVDEADIGKVALGQPVRILLDAYPESRLSAVVEKIDFASHSTETGGNAYFVEASLPLQSDFTYRIGMSGDAEIVLAEKRNVIQIPLASLMDEKYVYVKNVKKYEKRKVTLGIQSDTAVEIKSGLSVGEEVSLQPDEVESRMNPKKKT